MALRPAGVHAVEHLRPVLRLGPPGPGVELQNRVGLVIFPGQQRRHAGLFHLLFQLRIVALQFFQQFRVVRLLPHFTQGGQILPGGAQFFLPGDFVLQLFQADLHFLGALEIVPESVLFRFRRQALYFPFGPVHVQGVREFPQFRFQFPQFLPVNVVLDERHILFLVS